MASGSPAFDTGWPGSRRHIWDSAPPVATVARSTKASFRDEAPLWSLCFSKEKLPLSIGVFRVRLNGNEANRKTKTLGKTEVARNPTPSSAALPTYRPQQALGLLDGPIAPQEAHKHHHGSHSNENVDAWGGEELNEQAACITT